MSDAKAAAVSSGRLTPKSPVADAVSVFRWDLDKTYLRTEFQNLRGMFRVPFETAAEKVAMPAVAELIRAIRQVRGRRALVYFISASPPQIARAIREKFALDGVEIDGIVFKDQLQILMRGKFRGLREQVGFKLCELLTGRVSLPATAPEYLFGDDWESDPLIYALYADTLRGRLEAADLDALLGQLGVDGTWRRKIGDLVAKLERTDAVKRIFIHLERRSPPALFRAFGPKLVPAFNYLQTAACLYQDGEVDLAGIAGVAQVLATTHAYTPEMIENSIADVFRRQHLSERKLYELADGLVHRGLMPLPVVPFRERIERWIGRWRRRIRRPVPSPAVDWNVDYMQILNEWRTRR